MTEQNRIEICARIAHSVNREYSRSLGDFSHDSWWSSPEWQRTSCIAGVRGVLNGNTPEQSHESWTAHKLKEGWVYGPEKDAAAKRHPCLVPYTELPPTQRLKDTIFVAVVRSVWYALSDPAVDPSGV